MTKLTKEVRRVASTRLGDTHGRDKDRRLIVTLLPGNGLDIEDMISLKPEGLRSDKAKFVRVNDLWSYMLRCEDNVARMKKLRELKEKNRLKKEAARSRRILHGRD